MLELKIANFTKKTKSDSVAIYINLDARYHETAQSDGFIVPGATLNFTAVR